MPNELSRRTVVGAVWAAPVVALAAAAPAAAASPLPPTPRFVDQITITTAESNFMRTLFQIDVTGSGFSDVIGVGWETNDWNVAYPQGFTQFWTSSAETATGWLEIPTWHEEIVEYQAILEVTILGKRVSYEYTRRP
ncbi:hypothetical protein SCB71_16550 [Herbiconiux sp. KACC 21604]|uniref:hypothetical protein n=1 Tax=unclassified Herbiconiux TaxID=2618217 RepID=UPI001492DA13|nr:hypothetical protein [Herbiconiux sp. SALV-R1]QJU54709.1 hypothetical protein HL652_14510 [Herbiconiux sp. SALV-R1]WPO85813.1 hypothetical protein SCB71_16550 [Herbiconiux sp. KACC 21604]